VRGLVWHGHSMIVQLCDLTPIDLRISRVWMGWYPPDVSAALMGVGCGFAFDRWHGWVASPGVSRV
jgi:hypothetical protein